MNDPLVIRALWMSIILIISALIAVVGGVLAWRGGTAPTTAIITGGGTFAGAIAVFLAIAHFLSEGS